MKKEHTFPTIEVLRFTSAEVITASNLAELEDTDGAEFDFETELF